eukprot:SAG31_NODE_13668_length_854_cov_1.127152_1_plen_207_part_00
MLLAAAAAARGGAAGTRRTYVLNLVPATIMEHGTVPSRRILKLTGFATNCWHHRTGHCLPPTCICQEVYRIVGLLPTSLLARCLRRMAGRGKGTFGPLTSMAMGIGIFFALFVTIFLLGRLADFAQEVYASYQARARERTKRRRKQRVRAPHPAPPPPLVQAPGRRRCSAQVEAAGGPIAFASSAASASGGSEDAPTKGTASKKNE